MPFGSSMLLFGKSNEEHHVNQEQNAHVAPPKKPRTRPGIAYPDAIEVIALSPTDLMAKNRFVCEICYKGFPREQNLQLHKRGHNLPWNLKQKTTKEKDDVKVRKVYVCPEVSCVHHQPSHALGDLTGIKKHYSRKHCEKKYKCQKCSKMYAVESDLKAHSKTCNNKEYECHCGTIFSRRDSFISHMTFCEAMAKGGGTVIRHPPTLSNHHPPQPSISISHVSQNSFMNTPSPAFFQQTSDEQTHHKYQPKSSDTSFFTNLMNKEVSPMKSYGNGEGSSLFSGNHGYMYDTTAAMPQSSATSLYQNASVLGSMSSSSCKNFGKSEAFQGINGGYLYEQQGGRGGRGYDDDDGERNMEEQQQAEVSNMGFQQSRGAAFTRDFLGVGEQHSNFGGASFL